MGGEDCKLPGPLVTAFWGRALPRPWLMWKWQCTKEQRGPANLSRDLRFMWYEGGFLHSLSQPQVESCLIKVALQQPALQGVFVGDWEPLNGWVGT